MRGARAARRSEAGLYFNTFYDGSGRKIGSASPRPGHPLGRPGATQGLAGSAWQSGRRQDSLSARQSSRVQCQLIAFGGGAGAGGLRHSFRSGWMTKGIRDSVETSPKGNHRYTPLYWLSDGLMHHHTGKREQGWGYGGAILPRRPIPPNVTITSATIFVPPSRRPRPFPAWPYA